MGQKISPLSLNKTVYGLEYSQYLLRRKVNSNYISRDFIIRQLLTQFFKYFKYTLNNVVLLQHESKIQCILQFMTSYDLLTKLKFVKFKKKNIKYLKRKFKTKKKTILQLRYFLKKKIKLYKQCTVLTKNNIYLKNKNFKSYWKIAGLNVVSNLINKFKKVDEFIYFPKKIFDSVTSLKGHFSKLKRFKLNKGIIKFYFLLLKNKLKKKYLLFYFLNFISRYLKFCSNTYTYKKILLNTLKFGFSLYKYLNFNFSSLSSKFSKLTYVTQVKILKNLNKSGNIYKSFFFFKPSFQKNYKKKISRYFLRLKKLFRFSSIGIGGFKFRYTYGSSFKYNKKRKLLKLALKKRWKLRYGKVIKAKFFKILKKKNFKGKNFIKFVLTKTKFKRHSRSFIFKNLGFYKFKFYGKKRLKNLLFFLQKLKVKILKKTSILESSGKFEVLSVLGSKGLKIVKKGIDFDIFVKQFNFRFVHKILTSINSKLKLNTILLLSLKFDIPIGKRNKTFLKKKSSITEPKLIKSQKLFFYPYSLKLYNSKLKNHKFFNSLYKFKKYSFPKIRYNKRFKKFVNLWGLRKKNSMLLVFLGFCFNKQKYSSLSKFFSDISKILLKVHKLKRNKYRNRHIIQLDKPKTKINRFIKLFLILFKNVSWFKSRPRQPVLLNNSFFVKKQILNRFIKISKNSIKKKNYLIKLESRLRFNLNISTVIESKLNKLFFTTSYLCLFPILSIQSKFVSSLNCFINQFGKLPKVNLTLSCLQLKYFRYLIQLYSSYVKKKKQLVLSLFKKLLKKILLLKFQELKTSFVNCKNSRVSTLKLLFRKKSPLNINTLPAYLYRYKAQWNNFKNKKGKPGLKFFSTNKGKYKEKLIPFKFKISHREFLCKTKSLRLCELKLYKNNKFYSLHKVNLPKKRFFFFKKSLIRYKIRKFNKKKKVSLVSKRLIKKTQKLSKLNSLQILKKLNNLHLNFLVKSKIIKLQNISRLNLMLFNKLIRFFRNYFKVKYIQILCFFNSYRFLQNLKKRQLVLYKQSKKFISFENLKSVSTTNLYLTFKSITFPELTKLSYTILRQQFFLKKYFKNNFFLLIILNCLFLRTSTLYLLRFISVLLKLSKKHYGFLSQFDRAFKYFFNLLSFQLPIQGLQFIIRGRVNGAPRKKNKIYKYGKLYTQTRSANFDYNQLSVETKYGSFGLRIWRFF